MTVHLWWTLAFSNLIFTSSFHLTVQSDDRKNQLQEVKVSFKHRTKSWPVSPVKGSVWCYSMFFFLSINESAARCSFYRTHKGNKQHLLGTFFSCRLVFIWYTHSDMFVDTFSVGFNFTWNILTRKKNPQTDPELCNVWFVCEPADWLRLLILTMSLFTFIF